MAAATFRYVNSLARVFKSGNQSIASATPTALTFDSETYDTNTIHDNVTNNSRLTAPIAGKYVVHGTVQWDFSAAGNIRGMYFYKNGVIYAALQFVPPTLAGANGNIVAGADIIDLAAGDYVELLAFQDSGGALNALGGSGANTHFGMGYIGV